MEAVYIDHMGNDLRVANVARVSFNNWKEEFDSGDEGLIKFLASGWSSKDWDKAAEFLQGTSDKEGIRNLLNEVKNIPTHWTPFAHCQISLRMTAPVPIRTQCFKHKQGFVENEQSKRYLSSTPSLFIPDFRSKPEGSIKQGSGGIHPLNGEWQNQYIAHCNQAISTYENMIAGDVAPEQARFVLPQGVEVTWIWTGSLAAYARFAIQRSDSHAQGEINELEKLVSNIIEPLFPVSWKALKNNSE
ncbi:MAG: thymidylate synthase (FAD) [Methylophaga sp.]|nr:thymidylate synthase (FAD) [Methylophaga sp.]